MAGGIDNLSEFILHRVQDAWARLSGQGCVVEEIIFDKVVWHHVNKTDPAWIEQMVGVCEIDIGRDEKLDGVTIKFVEKDGSPGMSHIFFGSGIFRAKGAS